MAPVSSGSTEHSEFPTLSPLCQGYVLNGMKIAVRYPDRIPQGMGMSRSALTSDDLQEEDMEWVLFDPNVDFNGWFMSFLLHMCTETNHVLDPYLDK